MKLLCCVSIMSVFLMLSEGKPQDNKGFTPDDWPNTTTAGPGVNLKGKMVTLSQSSKVTFYQPKYDLATGESTEETPKITTPSTTSTTKTRPTPLYSGVSVCLRFMSDFSSLILFKLSHGSPLYFSRRNPWTYTLRLGNSEVSLSPEIFFWSSVWTKPWTSVCVVVDSRKNVVQVFQGGSISIRKIPPFWMVWSGEPVLDMSDFDGQVTDLEVWDYALQYREVLSYMQNYWSCGNVLTWSNIAYRSRGDVLVEETYAQQMSEREGQPIRSGQGWGRRVRYKKMFNGMR